MPQHDADEHFRLQALKTFDILDTPPEPVFDRLTQFAAKICDTPIAIISILDEDRQWFKSAVGMEVSQTDRTISFCTYTICDKVPFVVEDAAHDQRFAGNPLVTGPPNLRFYAGVPLSTPEGATLGTLAVLDRVPRRLSEMQFAVLEMLAEQVMVHIELRRRRLELERIAAERDRINATLARQTGHLRDAQRIAHVGSWTLDVPALRLTCSTEIYRIFGLVQQHEMEDFSAFMQSVHRDDRIALWSAIEATLRGERPLDIEHRIVRPGGEVRYVHERAELPPAEQRGRILAGTVQDITEQHKAQEQLRLLQACVARLNDIVMITEAEPIDAPGPPIVFVNHAFELHTGYTRDEVLGRSPRLLQGPRTQRAELDRIRTALKNKEPVSAELINYTRDGKEIWIEIGIVPVADASGRVTHFAAIERDVTQRKAAEQEIERLAFYDPLTDLPNRRLLIDRLRQALAAAARNRNTGALLYIDLDNFKNLNDTLGHDKGDLLLKQIARLLERSVRRSNTVARLGGDEFVIMLEDLSENPLEAAAQAELVAEKVLAGFQSPFQLGGYDYRNTPSVGVALFDSSVDNVEELLKRADIAMYQAKASGRNTIRFFDPEMQAVINARVALERDFRISLDQREFSLHYQPQSNDQGKLTGFEALARWNHPARGMVAPDVFIPLADDTGLSMRFGQWVLETACAQLAAWAKQPDTAHMCLAVNVSARQFRHPDFVRRTLSVIDASGVDPHRLRLELTESALTENPDDTIAKMTELQARGVRFSLDDFGTGYSSLSFLKRLPLDQLKIDRTFVKDLLHDPNVAAIARTIVALGNTLGLQVIAEGVETEAQRDFLARHGCHLYQGNLFSRPVPAEQVPSLA